MSNNSTIESLIKEREEIERKLEAFIFRNRRYGKSQKALDNSQWTSNCIAFILCVIAAIIYEWLVFDKFKWSLVWSTAFILVYPGVIVWMILGLIIDPLTQKLIRIFFSVSNDELSVFEKHKSEQTSAIKRMNVEIAKLKEIENDRQKAKERVERRKKLQEDEFLLLEQLKGLVVKIESSEISILEAQKSLSVLTKENIRIRFEGYQIVNSITFTNLFKKIEKLINPPDPKLPISRTALIKPNKSYSVNNEVQIPLTPNQVEIPKTSTRAPEYQENAKQQYLRIVREGNFGYRLDCFGTMLKESLCTKKLGELILTYLNLEFQEFSKSGFIIFESHHYTQIINELSIKVSNIGLNIIDSFKNTPVQITSIPIDNSTNGILIPEDITVFEIFGTPNSTGINEISEKVLMITPKQDYQVLHKTKADIGNAGELFVYWKERNKLLNAGFEELSVKVKHVSKESDSYGYDIESYFEDGTPIYLEVKTTTGGPKTPFELSQNEIESMGTLQNYFIVRVFDFNMKAGKGSTYSINKSQFENYFDLVPTSFKAKPKK